MKIAFFFPAKICKSQGKYLLGASPHLMFPGLKLCVEEIDLLSFFNEDGEIDSNYKQEMDLNLVRLRPLPFYRNTWELYFLKLPGIFWRMRNIFKRHAREWGAIILYECGVVSQIAFLLSKAYGVPNFFWIGGDPIKSVQMNLRFSNSFKGLLKMLMTYENDLALKYLAGKATGLLVTGKDLQSHFQRLNLEVYHFTATGVRAADIEPDLPARRLQEDDHLFKILTVCSVWPSKALEFVIEALPVLHEMGIKTLYKIVGPQWDPAYASRLNNLIKGKKLEEHARLLGAIRHGPDLFRLYREADVFVLPSLTEGTPKVLPEAMAKGLPLVVTRVGGVPELVDDEVQGFLVPPGHKGELTAALSKIARDKELRYRMGKKALKKAAEFTIERQMRGIAEWIIEKTHNKEPTADMTFP